MRMHARNERIARDRRASGIRKDPGRSLVVPNEGMPDDDSAVSFAERNVPIGGAKVELSGSRLDIRPLQHILRRDAVEVTRDERVPDAIGAVDLTTVDRSSHEERRRERLFETRWRGRRPRSDAGATSVIREPDDDHCQPRRYI